MCFTDSAPYTKKRHNNCVWGGSQIGGRQKCLHLLKHQRLSATIVVCQTKEIIFCRSKSCYFCWSNYVLFQGITSLKVLYINNSENVWSRSQKMHLIFHKLHNWEHCRRPKQSLISANCRYTLPKAYCALVFDTVLAIGRSEKNNVWNVFPTWSEVQRFFLHLEVTTQVPR